MRRGIALLIVGACGSGVSQDPGADALLADSPAARCTPNGAGTATGTSKGQAIGPIQSAFVLAAGDGYVLVLDDDATAGACHQPQMTGFHINMIFCAAPATRHYDVVSDGGWTCPNDHPTAVIKDDVSGADHADALGGTIDVTSTTSECITGTYSLMFDTGGGSDSGDPVSGTFNAVVCP